MSVGFTLEEVSFVAEESIIQNHFQNSILNTLQCFLPGITTANPYWCSKQHGRLKICLKVKGLVNFIYCFFFNSLHCSTNLVLSSRIKVRCLTFIDICSLIKIKA